MNISNLSLNFIYIYRWVAHVYFFKTHVILIKYIQYIQLISLSYIYNYIKYLVFVILYIKGGGQISQIIDFWFNYFCLI